MIVWPAQQGVLARPARLPVRFNSAGRFDYPALLPLPRRRGAFARGNKKPEADMRITNSRGTDRPILIIRQTTQPFSEAILSPLR